MARPREAPTDLVRFPAFLQEDLHVLVNILRQRAKERASGPRVLGALVVAARQLPPEVVEALIPAYDERAKEVIDAERE